MPLEIIDKGNLKESKLNSNLINNYRMGGYLLVAIGLINLRYQSAHSGVVQHSLTIIIPGSLLLISTWIPSISSKLQSKATQAICLALGLLLVAYAILN